MNGFMPTYDPSQAFQFSMQRAAEAAATEAALRDLIAQQENHDRTEAANVAAKGLGMTAKAAVGRGASYTASAAPTTSAMSLAGQAVGAAGTAYNAYSNISQGLGSVRALNRAVDSGMLDSHEEADLRQKMYGQGIKRTGIGAASGAASGAMTAGPVGAVVGGILGSLGGTFQAASAYGDQPGAGAYRDTARANWQYAKEHPWASPMILSELPAQLTMVAGRKLFRR